MVKSGIARKIFVVLNGTFLILLAAACVLPIVHILALSFSSRTAADAGLVGLWPVQFSLKSYSFVLEKKEFIQSFLMTLQRIFVGYLVNMFLIVTSAYALSKEENEFRGRKYYVRFLFLTMIFNGGLIPTYLLVKSLHLLDTVWALVLPTALPIFNMLIMLNFLRGLPKEILESAYVDGASHWVCLFRICLPLSLPCLATLSIYVLVGHWNSWFDGLIYINNSAKYPLQTYLQTVVVGRDLSLLMQNELTDVSEISDRTMRAAQIFVATFPILCVYPFLQKYFVKGMVIGSVKG